jgi:capsular exopolysaccharide synthesis family protein
MSRILDALRVSDSRQAISATEQQASSLAREFLEALEQKVGGVDGALKQVTRVANDSLDRFPSLPVSVGPDSRLVCVTNQESLAAEKFRFLGVRLRQIRQSQQECVLRKVLITSTIAEEGKSIVAGNLAVTLARKKEQKVLLIDGDLRRPVMAARFGLEERGGLSEWLRRGPGSLPAIYQLDQLDFFLLPAGSPPENPLELMQSGRLAELVSQLETLFDWILIDSPPVLPLADSIVWARLVDGILLVTREGTTEKKHLQRGLEALEHSKLLGVVLNSATNVDHTKYYQRYAQDPLRVSGQRR